MSDIINRIDLRHKTIIDASPVLNTKKEILTVGCGSAELELALQELGYKVNATDLCVDEYESNKRKDNLIKIISSKIANMIRSYILDDNCTDTGCS